MDFLICITRSLTGLEAKINRCQSKFGPPDSDNPNWQQLYEMVSVPITQVKSSPVIERLSAAWQRLAKVDKWNANTLTDVLVVLTECVASSDADSHSLPILRIEPEPERPKPTAAHPRAFRGTKYKPPKPKRPIPVNLQATLCHPKNQAIVLQALWQYRQNAVAPLCDLGYNPTQVNVLMALSTPPAEPNLFLRHPNVPIHAKSLLFPSAFREDILPLLRGIAWPGVEAILDVFWQLELHQQLELHIAVSRFLAQSPNSSALDWLQQIAHQANERHLILLIFAIELDVARSPGQVGVDEVLNALHKYALPECYPRWAYIMLAALRDGISASYLRDGIYLAGEFEPRHRFYYPNQCQDFSRSVVEEILYRLPDDEWYRGMSIWEKAAKLPGLCEVLAAVKWDNLTVKQISQYLRLLFSFSYYEDKEAYNWRTKWAIFKKHRIFIEKQLFSVSETYIEQWVSDFCHFIDRDIKKDVLGEVMKDAVILATRLAKLPYQSHSYRGLAYAPFLRICNAPLRQRVLETPEKSLKCLDKACRRENEAQLIVWGMTSILKEQATFAVDSLWYAPKKLVNTAKILGPMSWELCRNIMQTFAHHPIMTTDFDSLSLSQLYHFFQTIETFQKNGKGVTREHHISVPTPAHWNENNVPRYNPIPRALRDHFDGKLTLRKNQLERHRQIILARLLKARLQVLEEIAEQTLWQGFETATNIPEVKTALQFLRDLFSRQYSNKRAFRRFLKKYVAGNTNYLQQHPLTFRWIKRHSKIPLALWTRGIDLESYEEKQYVSITLEQNPLEVLKLGTYVGSCLGVGGLCTDSAIAVVLDINKQVLYARDENGVILARQLLAISQDELLVPFEVYPTNTSSHLKMLFYEYDQHFANRLGIKLFNKQSENDNYKIEYILSEYWWDDGAWHFEND